MPLITNEYRALNEELHSRAKYGHRGHRHVDDVDLFARRFKARTVLDYGCGAATLKSALERINERYEVHNYDPCVAAFAAEPPECDISVCTDVLEHIEPDCLDDVLNHLRAKSRHGCFCVIATRYDSTKLLADGSNPHKIVENAAWWRFRLGQLWRVYKVYEVVGKQCTFWLVNKADRQ